MSSTPQAQQPQSQQSQPPQSQSQQSLTGTAATAAGTQQNSGKNPEPAAIASAGANGALPAQAQQQQQQQQPPSQSPAGVVSSGSPTSGSPNTVAGGGASPVDVKDGQELRCLIENHSVGCIIGKGGANVKRVRDETGKLSTNAIFHVTFPSDLT
jgi:hypothetical protein